MSPHYSMVAVNLLLCGAIGVGLYIWQKKLHRKINLFALFILLSVLPLLSLLRPGPYESGDMMLHATRAQPFYDSIMQFHQLPRWAGELNLGYGDTYFEFLYITPYIFTTIFHFLGMSFIDSVKLVLAFPYVLSGVFMYLWIRDEFGEKAGFISAIFYLFAPYHLVDMHFRATVAESASFLFLPLLCWLSSRYLRTPQTKFLIFFSLMYGLFLLTHAVIFFTFTPFLLLYILLVWYSRKTRTIRELVFIGLAMVFSMLLTAFYWLPVLAETQYIYQSVMSGIEFHPLWFYLISPWMFGFLFQGHHGELSFVVGYTQLLVIGIALYFLRKRIFKTVEKRFVLLCLAFASLFFIMMQSFTLPLWLHLPIMKNFQFAYRLLEVIVFCIAAIAGVALMKIKRKTLVVGICAVTILYTALNWGNRGTLPAVNDAWLKDQLLHGPTVTGWYEPTVPIWVNRDDTSLLHRPAAPLEITEGTATVAFGIRTAISHHYVVTAKTPSFIRENTFYFPGWFVLVDGTPAPLSYDKEKYSGVIHFWVPQGRHDIRVVFGESPIRGFSDRLSLLAVGWFAIGLILMGILKMSAKTTSSSAKYQWK